MSIRIRTVGGVTVALCAARSVGKPGDRYLDDVEHMALARKFWMDHPACGIEIEPYHRALMEREESNNPNREWWDATYAASVPPPEEGR